MADPKAEVKKDGPIYEMVTTVNHDGNDYPKGSRVPDALIALFKEKGFAKLYAPAPLPAAPQAPVSGEGQLASQKLAELKEAQAKAEAEAKEKAKA